jgi:CubicO group peptidase (beta-lactamase class C family)
MPMNQPGLLATVVCVGLVTVGSLTSAKAPTTLPRSAPEAEGISSAAIQAFVEEAEQKLNALHSLMIVRHGKVVAEGWWAPYAAAEPHQMFSLSKSFTSTAVGLAVAEGKLHVNDPVLKFFPDEAPAEPSANLRAMRVRDLLTMSAGHHDEDIQGFPYNGDENVVKVFLSKPVAHKPGTFFLYNTPASYMLSAIVQRVTGQTLIDYLGPRLFQPLGIEHPTWDASKQGVSMGGFGLNIRTEDIARFGQLYLQKGMWQGKPLVPASWVEAATSRQMSNGSSPNSDWEQGYGYQFWQSRHGVRGDGAHGQFCLILPQYDAVIAITSGTRDMGSVMNLVWDRLLPAFKPAALTSDTAAHSKMKTKLASLVLKPQTGTAAGAVAKRLTGKPFTFASNPQSIESIVLESSDATGVTLMVRIAGTDQRLSAAPGTWRKGQMIVRGTTDPIATSGAWTANDTYSLNVVRYRTPFMTTYKLRFAEDQLTLDLEQNVGPANARTLQLIGKPASTTAGGRQ